MSVVGLVVFSNTISHNGSTKDHVDACTQWLLHCYGSHSLNSHNAKVIIRILLGMYKKNNANDP